MSGELSPMARALLRAVLLLQGDEFRADFSLDPAGRHFDLAVTPDGDDYEARVSEANRVLWKAGFFVSPNLSNPPLHLRCYVVRNPPETEEHARYRLCESVRDFCEYVSAGMAVVSAIRRAQHA